MLGWVFDVLFIVTLSNPWTFLELQWEGLFRLHFLFFRHSCLDFVFAVFLVSTFVFLGSCSFFIFVRASFFVSSKVVRALFFASFPRCSFCSRCTAFVFCPDYVEYFVFFVFSVRFSAILLCGFLFRALCLSLGSLGARCLIINLKPIPNSKL